MQSDYRNRTSDPGGVTAARDQRVTLSDVARRADVSIASVSRVLNNPDAVRPVLQERIRKAITELGYIPSGAARALATRRSRAVGAIVPTLDDAIFAAGISALQRRLRQLDYSLLIAASEYDWAQELQEARVLLSYGIEGIMLIGEAHDPKLYAMLKAHGVVYVNGWVYDPCSPHPCIGFDNRVAARQLVDHLLDLGHSDIGMLAGVTDQNDRANDRVQGVREALADRGLELSDSRIVEMPYGVAEGREGLRALMSATPRQPTAVVCGNDVLALGALLECQAAGIMIPQSLSITGFDDLPIAAHTQPPLTTVHVPSAEMGTGAANYLVRQLAGKPVAEHVNVETSIVLRCTTARPSTRIP